MEITTWTISADRQTLDLGITSASNASALRLWTPATFKDYSQAVDLTSKLTGAATESITITPLDIGRAYFDGVYFIEVEDTSELVIAVTAELTRYKECMVNRLMEVGVCEDCLKAESVALRNVQGMLRSLEYALELYYLDEVFSIINALDVYCSDTCDSCGRYDNLLNTDYYTLNQ